MTVIVAGVDRTGHWMAVEHADQLTLPLPVSRDAGLLAKARSLGQSLARRHDDAHAVAQEAVDGIGEADHPLFDIGAFQRHRRAPTQPQQHRRQRHDDKSHERQDADAEGVAFLHPAPNSGSDRITARAESG